MGLRETLWQWRREQARQEGVEVFRVVPNAVLDAFLLSLPRTKEELLSIKGIKEAKYRKYGKAILAMIAAEGAGPPVLERQASGEETVAVSALNTEVARTAVPPEAAAEQTYTISQFLDGLNIELSGMAARVQGEVSSVDERERVVYFTLKDSQDDSTLNCLMFRSAYQLAGVRLAVGDAVVVEGAPDIYKPSGRLALKVGFVELSGAGALKKAYDALLKQLTEEGLLAPERKRPLPSFPERIALITSEQGAALGDFTMNLGQLGLAVDFYPASVEGKRAVPDILASLRAVVARASQYDLVVLIRGGGSLESLQAFNNEMLVRAVATCPLPTLVGVGHEKDVTLAALVGDVMVSTPTATARTLREPFERARQTLAHAAVLLPARFEQVLVDQRSVIERGVQALSVAFPRLRERFLRAEQDLRQVSAQLSFVLHRAREQLEEAQVRCLDGYRQTFERFTQSLTHVAEKLREYDPERALALGYSLIRRQGTLVRSVTSVAPGEMITVQVQDGSLEAEVKKIIHT